MRWFHIAFALTFPTWPMRAHAEPVVTMTRGDVAIVASDRTSPAPSGCFRLNYGQALRLGDGGVAFVMDGATRTRLEGPRTWVATAPAQTGSVQSAALTGILQRQTSSAKVGATRGEGRAPRMQRPRDGSREVALTRVEWSCDACGPQNVTLTNATMTQVLWRSTADSAVGYSGPLLEPGDYLVQVGQGYHTFHVAVPAEVDGVRSAIADALAASDTVSFVERLSIEAAIWTLAGFHGQANDVLGAALKEHPDDPAVRALHTSYAQP